MEMAGNRERERERQRERERERKRERERASERERGRERGAFPCPAGDYLLLVWSIPKPQLLNPLHFPKP